MIEISSTMIAIYAIIGAFPAYSSMAYADHVRLDRISTLLLLLVVWWSWPIIACYVVLELIRSRFTKEQDQD